MRSVGFSRRSPAPGAVAHLILRTRVGKTGAGRTSPVRSVGVFSRRREAGDARGLRMPDPGSSTQPLLLLPGMSHPSTDFQGSSPQKELILNSLTNCRSCEALPRPRLRAPGPQGQPRPKALQMGQVRRRHGARFCLRRTKRTLEQKSSEFGNYRVPVIDPTCRSRRFHPEPGPQGWRAPGPRCCGR